MDRPSHTLGPGFLARARLSSPSATRVGFFFYDESKAPEISSYGVHGNTTRRDGENYLRMPR
jgi:hypothetical protein